MRNILSSFAHEAGFSVNVEVIRRKIQSLIQCHEVTAAPMDIDEQPVVKYYPKFHKIQKSILPHFDPRIIIFDIWAFKGFSG